MSPAVATPLRVYAVNERQFGTVKVHVSSSTAFVYVFVFLRRVIVK